MNQITFRELDARAGGESELEPCSLSEWYARVRDVPIPSLGIGDLCKSVRQGLYPEYVIPVALRSLEIEPLAGEMYEGELAVSLRWIRTEFWRAHPEFAEQAVGAMREAFIRLDGDMKEAVSANIARIEAM